MRHVPILILALLFLQLPLSAQELSQRKSRDTQNLPYMVKDNDTMPIYQYEDVLVVEELSEEEIARQKEWYRTLFNVQKVWPYAVAASERMQEVDAELAALDKKKDQRKYMKAKQDSLKNEFEEQLKNLSYNQGTILVKLIDRQTGKTSFDLIKEYKSGLSAFFWQNFASVFGMDLKEKYDPEKDVLIERAIKYLGYEK